MIIPVSWAPKPYFIVIKGPYSRVLGFSGLGFHGFDVFLGVPLDPVTLLPT